MGTFKISVDRFSWICGPEDDPDDRCLHGHVAVQIGENVMEGDGTVSATALYLLKSLKEDKRMSPHSIQMVPCCGFFLIANEELSEVSIDGCDNGMDWSVVHEDAGVRLILPSGESELVSVQDYREEVVRFADKVERYYRSCLPKTIPENEFDRNGYIAFWNEWYRRYADAVLADALEKGREIELQYGGMDYFISHDRESGWYLYCEQTEEKQTFRSPGDLYDQGRLGRHLLKDELAGIRICCVL